MRVTLSMATAWWCASNPTLSLAVRKEGWDLRGEAIQEVKRRIQLGQVNETLAAGIAYLCCIYVSLIRLLVRHSSAQDTPNRREICG